MAPSPTADAGAHNKAISGGAVLLDTDAGYMNMLTTIGGAVFRNADAGFISSGAVTTDTDAGTNMANANIETFSFGSVAGLGE